MLRVMMGGMFRSCHKDKITKPVVSFFTIPVMDNFIVAEFTSKFFFHLILMFSDILFKPYPFKPVATRTFCNSIVPARVIFSKFCNCLISASTCTVPHFFIWKNTWTSTSKALFFVINCPYKIYLFIGMSFVHPFKFAARLMPNAFFCMSPSFRYIGYSHV